MSDDDRKDRSVLAGMTRNEAEALVADYRIEDVLDQVVIRSWNRPTNRAACEALLALAALGARYVGAKEHTEMRWGCPECGVGGKADEDHCCVTCGADCVEAECRVLVLEGE